jgi:hypothetical protein
VRGSGTETVQADSSGCRVLCLWAYGTVLLWLGRRWLVQFKRLLLLLLGATDENHAKGRGRKECLHVQRIYCDVNYRFLFSISSRVLVSRQDIPSFITFSVTKYKTCPNFLSAGVIKTDSCGKSNYCDKIVCF